MDVFCFNMHSVWLGHTDCRCACGVEKATAISVRHFRYRHFRPPYGSLDRFGFLVNSDYAVDLWSLSTSDWETHAQVTNRSWDQKTAMASLVNQTKLRLQRELENDRQAVIYLGHDRELVFKSLNTFLDYVESFKKYTFVRMDECTGIPETFL